MYPLWCSSATSITQRDVMLIIAYIYLRDVTRISHSAHAYKSQPNYNNSHHCTRHNSYIHPSTTPHAIQEILQYHNVLFERRSLLPIPWCMYTVSL
jgi:hypothetical protein